MSDFEALSEDFFEQDAPYDESSLGHLITQQRDIWTDVTDFCPTTFHGGRTYASPHPICVWFRWIKIQPGDTTLKLHVRYKTGTKNGDAEVTLFGGIGLTAIAPGEAVSTLVSSVSPGTVVLEIPLPAVSLTTQTFAQVWVQSATPRDPEDRLVPPTEYIPSPAYESWMYPALWDRYDDFALKEAGLPDNPRRWEFVRADNLTDQNAVDSFRILQYSTYYAQISNPWVPGGSGRGFLLEPPPPQNWRDSESPTGTVAKGWYLQVIDWITLYAVALEFVRDTSDATSALQSARDSSVRAGKEASSVPVALLAAAGSGLAQRTNHLALDLPSPQYFPDWWDTGSGVEYGSEVCAQWPKVEYKWAAGSHPTENFYIPLTPHANHEQLNVVMGFANFYSPTTAKVSIELEVMAWADGSTVPSSLTPKNEVVAEVDVPIFHDNAYSKFEVTQDFTKDEFNRILTQGGWISTYIDLDLTETRPQMLRVGVNVRPIPDNTQNNMSVRVIAFSVFSQQGSL